MWLRVCSNDHAPLTVVPYINDDLFISCNDMIGKMLHNICLSAVAMSLRWATRGSWASYLSLCYVFLTSLLNVLHLLTLIYKSYQFQYNFSFWLLLSDLNKLQRFDIYLKKIKVQVYTILSLDRKTKRKRCEKNSKNGHWQGFTRYYNCLMLSPLPPHIRSDLDLSRILAGIFFM